jgi:antirestriction protein ArdC
MVRQSFNGETRRHDIYAAVTDRIVAALENGVRPWRQPWEGGDATARIMRPLQHDGRPYMGVNTIALWVEAAHRDYRSPYWISFRQAHILGGHVRKGEHHADTVYFDKKVATDRDENGEETQRQYRVIRAHQVFNAEQIAGLPEYYYAKPGPKRPEPERIQRAEDFFAAAKADIRHGGARAFYSPKDDYIKMPPLEKFFNAEGYYATLAHEFVHWTKREDRCNREAAKSRGDEKYAFEEIVAEMGSAFLCADLDITPKVPPADDDKASYIASWIRMLKNDKHAVFSAASFAQKAADFLHGLQKPAQAPGMETAAAQPSATIS